METNEVFRKQLFEEIENQISENNPPETKATFKRLRQEGFNDFRAKQMIGSCFSVELFDVLKNKKPFDIERYVKNLKKLPKEPS